MKSPTVLTILLLTLVPLFSSFFAGARQINISTYYPSPTGNYTKIHLVPTTSVTDFKTFCSSVSAGVGTIFTDANGFLQICKNDGTYASYPGSCFTRYATTIPISPTPDCPANYQLKGVFQPISMDGTHILYTWSCCFAGSSSSAITNTKSGCFSTYSSATGIPAPPADCNTFYPGGVDANAYDIGCEVINTGSSTIYKRNCCYNQSSIMSYTNRNPC